MLYAGKLAARSIALALSADAANATSFRSTPMASLHTDFLGIKSPNPFWLASAPPTDKEYNVERAFRQAGAAWCGKRSGWIRTWST
jgi:hypothetical protein